MRRGDIFPMVLFQFTPLREGRPGHGGFYHRHRHFNSRPSARGDLSRRPRVRASGKFQFTPLREGRLLTVEKVGQNPQFQFTPLREGRPPEG